MSMSVQDVDKYKDKEVTTEDHDEPEIGEDVDWYDDSQVNPHLNGETPW